MAHIHNVYDTGKYFEINGISRFIKETSATKLVLVQGDHNSEIITFKMPRYIDGHDMLLCNKIRVHYINVDTKTNDSSADIYEVKDLALCKDCEDEVTFTWTVEAPATKYAGNLAFVIKFECIEEGNILYQWNTAKYIGINVLAGLDNSEGFVDKYSSVIDKWVNELRESANIKFDEWFDDLRESAEFAVQIQSGISYPDYENATVIITGIGSYEVVERGYVSLEYMNTEWAERDEEHNKLWTNLYINDNCLYTVADSSYDIEFLGNSPLYPVKPGDVVEVRHVDGGQCYCQFFPAVKSEEEVVLKDVVASAVEEYMEKNPVEAGATEEQAEQIQKNKEDISNLSKEIEELKENGAGTLVSSVEPAEDDIPKIFFDEAMPQTKDYVKTKFRYISKTLDVEGYAEFKAQGNSTMRFPKKNETVKMYKDEALTEKLKIDFKGWGKQSKHVYKAYWNDLTLARDIVSARIWADIVRSRSDYESLPELLRTSPNQGVVDGFPVKVYSQGVYQGRYTLNIPKDAWMTNMDDELDTHCILCGEGYNSGCFREASMTEWTDEIHDTVPSVISNRWIEVINFVMNSTDEEFKANLDSYIDKQSVIDSHLFGLASCDMDGFGKNQLFITYDAIKWYAEKYDMDATWGMSWNGYFVATDYPRTSYEDYTNGSKQGNLLYRRIEELFYDELKARWIELRKGALSDANVINHFEQFTDICPPWLVEEDYASTTANGAFTGIPLQKTNNIQQLRKYAVERMAWVDEYFYRTPATGISLSQNTLTFTSISPITLTATLEPSDSTDEIIWNSTDETVAIVNNGVVTPLKNGRCTINTIAGVVSASCEVSVVGIIPQYTISNNLLGATNSNVNTVIDEGSTYSAIINANVGYTLEGATVTVLMGGEDITSTAYADGVITIENVIGNIEITVKAVDTSVAYSLEETIFDGTSSIDSGIKLQDEMKDYTVYVEFTPTLDTTNYNGKDFCIINAEEAYSPWAGWKINGAHFPTQGIQALKVKVWNWGQLWGCPHKFVVRHSNGIFHYGKENATALTETTYINTNAHNSTMRIGTGKYTGTISVKVWFETKTDEECIAMLN